MPELPDLSKGHFQGAHWKCQLPFLGTRSRGKRAPWSLFRRALIALGRLHPHVLIISQGSTSRILGGHTIDTWICGRYEHSCHCNVWQPEKSCAERHTLVLESQLSREKQATLLEVSSLSKESVSGAFLLLLSSFVCYYKLHNISWTFRSCLGCFWLPQIFLQLRGIVYGMI